MQHSDQMNPDSRIPSGKCQTALCLLLGLLLILIAGFAHALTLQAVNDSYGVPFGKPLLIEAFGVLENDILDDQSAGENGATAELLSGVSSGTLSCPTDMLLELCPDGSFDYTPNSSFSGTDSFTYQAVSGTVISVPATVKLSACTGGPGVFSCWQESSYISKLAELGYTTFQEGFEGNEWDTARSPDTASIITSQEITWTSNHPGTNEITTGTGPARTGMYGGYDSQHGFATGSFADCDVDNPPLSCLFHDGLSGKILPGGNALHGVGGYITGTTGASIAIILNGTTQIGVGKLPDPGHQFFGVIDARVTGFTGFEFRELDGKVGQERFIFGDDFIIANAIPCGLTGMTSQDILLRDTAAEWLLKCYYHDPGYTEPLASGSVFDDVAQEAYNAGFIEQLFMERITQGCNTSSTLYCPKDPVDKSQAVKLILRAEHGGDHTPPTVVLQIFDDVPLSHPDIDWINQAKTEGVTTGCGDGSNFCPGVALTQKGFLKMLGGAF